LSGERPWRAWGLLFEQLLLKALSATGIAGFHVRASTGGTAAAVGGLQAFRHHRLDVRPHHPPATTTFTSGSSQDMLALERALHETLPIRPEKGRTFYVLIQVAKGLRPPPPRWDRGITPDDIRGTAPS